MEKEDLRERIILRDISTLRRVSNPLELRLIIKRRDIDEKNYEITRERPSTLLYSFE